MKKIMFILPIIAIGASLVFSTYTIAAGDDFVTGRKIVIDAGHGGRDPGSTQCLGLEEADANLDLALRLKDKLEENGATVYLTREDDTYLTNSDRYTYANSTDGEVLISIHLNGSLDHDKNGTLGLYSKPRKDEEFASVLHGRLVSELDVPDLGVTNFMSGVTLRFNGPASIQESVYISNTQECVALLAGTRQDEIVQSLYNGLNDWFSVDREVFISPGQLK